MEGLNQVIQGLFYGPMKSMVFKAKHIGSNSIEVLAWHESFS